MSLKEMDHFVILSFFIFLSLFDNSIGQALLVKRLKPGLDKRVEYLAIGTVSQCQGPDSGHYTLIAQYNSDTACNSETIEHMSETLTFGSNKEEKIVNTLQALGRGIYVSGANIEEENLYYVQSGAGSLEGKYVYLRSSWARDDYLKKCTALTGYSFVSSKRLAIMIADRLDLNVFLSTAGAFEVFKKSSKTVCNGHSYIF